MRRALIGAGLATALLGAAAAQAAARDCAKLDDASARLICADPALAAADASMSAVLDRALAPLSASGRDALGQGEQAWLGYVASLCRVDETPPPDARPHQTPTGCLKSQYALRQRQLETATITTEGLVIGRVDTFSIKPSGDAFRVATTVVAYPRIDAPAGESETRWSALMQQEAQRRAAKEANGETDVWIDYRIVAVSPDVISAQITDYLYGHGAAHGVTQLKAINWLRRDGRVLTTRDLFDDASEWRVGLARLCFAALQAQGKRENVEYTVRTETELRPIVAKPERWTIERDGLGVQFIEYEIGAYVIGAPKIVIPWAELKPYLVAQPPAPAG